MTKERGTELVLELRSLAASKRKQAGMNTQRHAPRLLGEAQAYEKAATLLEAAFTEVLPVAERCCKRTDAGPKGEGPFVYCHKPAVGMWEQNREAYCSEHAPTAEKRTEIIAFYEARKQDIETRRKATGNLEITEWMEISRGGPIVPTWMTFVFV